MARITPTCWNTSRNRILGTPSGLQTSLERVCSSVTAVNRPRMRGDCPTISSSQAVVQTGAKTRLLTTLEPLSTTRTHNDAPGAFPDTQQLPTLLPPLQHALACPRASKQSPQPPNSTLETRTAPRMPPTPPAPILHPTALPTGSQSADSGPIHCPQPLHPLDWRMKEETK